ncbi:MAG: ATP phosphoribosyltransferase [Anaerolineaceae bacterium]|nr:ATP phosphoribosyltransferase [Anaerolineaceae bacterium]
MTRNDFTLALPSKGAISEPTLNFLRNSGLKVVKPNPRQYTGDVPAIDGLSVLFQRAKDVVYKVSDGTAHLGITGYDIVRENPSDDIIIINDKLGYGHCSLVVAVPESWVDVENMQDLLEVANDLRDKKQKNLRVATTFPHLTRQFLHKNHIHHFTIVKADGAIEAAPTIGYADMIVDLTQTGTTLRENHLKMLPDGDIIDSEACLIGNRPAFEEHPRLLEITKVLLEYMDAAMNAQQIYQVTVDIQGENSETIAKKIMENPLTAGLIGPTLAPIYTHEAGTWYSATLTIKHKDILEAVHHLIAIGGRHAVVMPSRYVFMQASHTYQKLLEQLGL